MKDTITQKFNLAQNIITGIHDLVENTDISYMDACVLYSEQNGIEIEVVAEYVKKSDLIRSSIEVEAEDLNFIKKTTRRLVIKKD